MNQTRLPKPRLFLFLLLQSGPTTFFLYGEPFYAQQKFGWNAGQIALTMALAGLCIAVGAYLGGQIAHHRHPRAAMRLGLIGALLSMAAGWAGTAAFGAAALAPTMACFSFSQALVWPGIETMLMTGEPPEQIAHLVGYFNLTWSLGTACAFLAVTPLMTLLGLNAAFIVPLAFFLVNLVTLASLPRYPLVPATFEENGEPAKRGNLPGAQPAREEDAPLTPAQRAAFRRLGWIANPFSYIAILVIVTYNPTIRARLELSFGAASVWCSLWFYVRTLGFELLRRWTWWHYRWRLLCGVFAAVMVSFAAIILAPNLAVLLAAQIVFGLGVGLLYQSSLFYSMAGSEAQGEHGGFHESFIGLGTMLGPLVAYGGARLVPGNAAFPIWLVLCLMGIGLTALLTIGVRRLSSVQN